jgi:hypothetical protein
MRCLQAPELLDVWERGSVTSSARRALTLLEAACPDLSDEALAGLSIGRRDGLLLSLRESTFGSRLVAVAGCPDCGEQLELAFEATDIRHSGGAVDSDEFSTVTADGYELRFRLPNSRDLMIAGEAGDVASAREGLLQRCLLSARRDEVDCEIDRLPEHAIDALEQEMLRVDGQANVQVELECPACQLAFTEGFDILAFFWSELDAWAQRTLVEVHRLASAYGWREREILELSPSRRGLYLGLVNG